MSKPQPIKHSIYQRLLMTMIGLVVVLLTVFTLAQIGIQNSLFENELERRVNLIKGGLI